MFLARQVQLLPVLCYDRVETAVPRSTSKQTVHGRCRAVADRDPPPDDDRGVDIDALARMLSREANRMRDSYVRTQTLRFRGILIRTCNTAIT